MKIILLVLLSFFIIGCEDDRTTYYKYNSKTLEDHARVKDYWYNNYREIIIRNETTGEIFLEVKGMCGYERRGDVVVTIEDGTKVVYPTRAFDGLFVDCDEDFLKEARATERILTFEKITYKTGNSKLVLVDEHF